MVVARYYEKLNKDCSNTWTNEQIANCSCLLVYNERVTGERDLI